MFLVDLLKTEIILCCKVHKIIFMIETVVLNTTLNIKLAFT